MGIPYYFYNLVKKYKTILDNKPPTDIYVYAIDFNGIIHPEASKESNIPTLYHNLWTKIIHYNNIYKPSKLLICADGVPPLAKIIQQRRRRYLTTYKKIIEKNDGWDTNAISCGTEFMDNLDDYLTSHISKYPSFIFNGSKNAGEGEHKIFTYLQQWKHEFENKSIVINGLDADLIILSLISGLNNIYLMRENNDEINYLNINNLKKSLLEELRPLWTNLEDIQIIENYCVMCSILGNDFIPHILSLNMKNNGLQQLIQITTKAIKEKGSLVSIDNKINHDCLLQIFTYIAETEDQNIFNEVSKIVEGRIVIDKMIKTDSLHQDIYNNYKKWRYYYYKSLSDINIHFESSLISPVVYNFIKGIYWTYQYYKKMELDYTWFYPFNYPPSSRDIVNYLSVSNNDFHIKENGKFLHPTIQLLLILPIQSNHLLNHHPHLKSFTTDYNKGLKHLFPESFKIQSFLKTKFHECYPVLPMIHIEKINNMYPL
jgi:5'-3' exonuclease